MTSHHVSLEQLEALASNRNEFEVAEQTRAHLAECSECTARLANIEKGADLTTSHDPASGGNAAVGSDTRTSAEVDISPSAHVVAVLSFDSRQLSSAFGVRSGRSVARQLLFSIGENDLDLRVAPDDGAWVVSGQVLGDCEGGRVELRGANITESSSMNELCEFYLPSVPPGSYSLFVKISNMEIEVPEFELRA